MNEEKKNGIIKCLNIIFSNFCCFHYMKRMHSFHYKTLSYFLKKQKTDYMLTISFMKIYFLKILNSIIMNGIINIYKLYMNIHNKRPNSYILEIKNIKI